MTETTTPTVSVASAFKLATFTTLPPRSGSSNARYPFREMKAGEMFFVPLTGDADKDTAKKLSTAASQAGTAIGAKFSVRTFEDSEGEHGPKGTVGVGVFRLREDQADDAEPAAA